MMLPTLLVVPGVHLKSDIPHSSAISVTPGFWWKSTGFLSEQWTMGICLISSLCSPLQRCYFLCCFLYDPVYCSNARKTVKNDGGGTQTASQAEGRIKP